MCILKGEFVSYTFSHTEQREKGVYIILFHIIWNMDRIVRLCGLQKEKRKGLTQHPWFPLFHLERVALQISVKWQASQCHGKFSTTLSSLSPNLGLLLQLPRTETCSLCIHFTESSLFFILYSFTHARLVMRERK